MAQKNHTPINIDDIRNKSSQVKTKTLTHSGFHIGVDKYSLILVISSLFFLSSVGFWGYVNYFLK